MTLKSNGRSDFNQLSLQQSFDRNPLSITKTYIASGVAPHGATQRWNYTVPAGRKFVISLVHCLVLRDATAASPAVMENLIRQQSDNRILSINQLNGVLGTVDHSELGQSAPFLAGAVLEGVTYDNSLNGTYKLISSMIGMEFDA